MQIFQALLSCLLVLVISVQAKAYQPGDLNGDGVVGPTDSIISLQVSAGLSPTITMPAVRTLVVSPEPGNPTESGNRLRTAALTTAASPAIDNQWLIVLEPGIYDVGSDYFDIPGYVHVQGSGMDVTTVQGNGVSVMRFMGFSHVSDMTIDRTDGESSNGQALILYDDNPVVERVHLKARAANVASGCYATTAGEITFRQVKVTVEGDNYAYGLYTNTTDIRAFDLDIEVTGSGSGAGLMFYSLDSSFPEVELNRVYIKAWKPTFPANGNWHGIELRQTNATISDATIDSLNGGYSFGIHTSYGATAAVYNSKIVASGTSSWSVFNTSDGNSASIQGSDLRGHVRNDNQSYPMYVTSTGFGAGSTAQGTVTCAGVWNAAYTFLPSSCP